MLYTWQGQALTTQAFDATPSTRKSVPNTTHKLIAHFNTTAAITAMRVAARGAGAMPILRR
jgi:hypothetical protein